MQGGDRDDITVRTLAGAVVGVAVAVMFVIVDDPTANLPTLLDEAMANLGERDWGCERVEPGFVSSVETVAVWSIAARESRRFRQDLLGDLPDARAASSWWTGSTGVFCMASSRVMSPSILIRPDMKACIAAWASPSTRIALAVS